MDYKDENPSRYWNLKDFGPYMDATAGKTNKPAVKKRHFSRSAADTRLPYEIRSELTSRGSHPSEWVPITRKEALYGLRSGKHMLLYRQRGKSCEPVKRLTSSMCSSGEVIALRHRSTPNERYLRSAGAMADFSPAKTAKGPISWEQWRHDLDSAVPIRLAKQNPVQSPIASKDYPSSADASAEDPLDASAEGVDIGPQIDFVDYTKILSGIGAGLVESTLKGIYHAGEAIARPSERLQRIDNLEYADIEGQEVPEKGLAGFSELATAMYEQAKLASENYREAKAKGEYFEAGKEVSHDPLMQMTGLGDLAVFGALGMVGRVSRVILNTRALPGNEGHFLAGSVTEGGTGTALTGHGAKFLDDGTFIVPEGTAITLPRPNINIMDRTGQYIERGDWEELASLAKVDPRVAKDIEGMTTWLPGAGVPEYTLFPPDSRINLFSNSLSVKQSTNLGQILESNQGCIQWAACTEFLNFNK